MYVRHNEDGLKNKMADLNDFRNCHKDITFPCGVHLTTKGRKYVNKAKPREIKSRLIYVFPLLPLHAWELVHM